MICSLHFTEQRKPDAVNYATRQCQQDVHEQYVLFRNKKVLQAQSYQSYPDSNSMVCWKRILCNGSKSIMLAHKAIIVEHVFEPAVAQELVLCRSGSYI